MRLTDSIKLLTLAAITAGIAACGGSAGNLPPAGPPGVPPPSSPAMVTNKIVGLGDSLTAGYQSSGMLGQTNVPLGQAEFTSIGLTTVPPTQENGFFSVFYSAAKGMTWVQQATPGVSVLPLIAGPGIGNQILPANPADTGGYPFATVPGRSSCDAFNQSAYAYTASSGAGATVRMNPTSVTYDLGIPSLTLAEAIGMRQPLTTTCSELYNPPASVAQAEIDALQTLVSGESENYYPVMEKYSSPASPMSPLQAAESLHPTLTTVWLGANDLLRYIFSAGTAPGIDTTASQVRTHMTTIIQGLRHSGSDVIVATLPNVIETPQFAIVGNPPSQAYCQIQTWLPCILYEFGLAPTFALAEGYTTGVLIASDSFLAPSGSQNAYLTETGLITLLASGANPASLSASANGSEYLTASFAAQSQSVNAAINSGILAAASATGVPVVRVDQIFDGIYSGSGPYFAAAASINPPKCCTLAFGGGLLTFDGLHPSDTGYALIASSFAQTANGAFGTSIPAINAAGAYTGAGGIFAPYPDPYALH
ncbi:MAG TPA: hypothetical protein VMV82_03065 [Candidatus Dormibacteraeota bacterium]|nr:hypothetical protein [Candidatus Dormibacteraeota bacterium]